MVIFLFTSSALGATEKLILIYDRGIGVLPLTLLNIYLIMVFVYFLCLQIFTRGGKVTESFMPGKRLTILLIFCIVYLLVGVATDVPIREVLSEYGIINIINMCLFVSILIWGIDLPEHLDALRKIALFCICYSAIYGLIRFIFFGGDPANVYDNVEHLNVRITYQDIGYSILFSFAFAYSILTLLKGRFSNLKERTFLVALSMLSIFNIIFSYRRNAWSGFIILLLWLTFVLDLKKKLLLIIIASICLAVLGPYVVSKRFAEQSGPTSHPTLTSDFSSGGEVSVKKGRFAELRNATMATLEEHPLLGFAPWGHYGSKFMLGQFAFFTHSAIVHVLFKTGIIGLWLFCWPIFSLAFWTVKRRRLFPENNKYQILCEAAFGGVLFNIPDIVFGTPIVVYRHLQILGFFIALIYCSYLFRNSETMEEVPSYERAG